MTKETRNFGIIIVNTLFLNEILLILNCFFEVIFMSWKDS